MNSLLDEGYWQKRLNVVKKALERNNFEVYLVQDPVGAKDVIIKQILPKTGARRISWGDSMTVIEIGLFDEIKRRTDLEFLDIFEKGIPLEDFFERRRQALLVDLFITGTNAVTRKGQLVNLDMLGNRIGAITFGPTHVVIMVGRNKIVADLEAAMDRIKNYSAPANAIRHNAEHPEMNPPCVETATCSNCTNPMRICNTWTITEKSFPSGRIKVVLINQDLGL